MSALLVIGSSRVNEVPACAPRCSLRKRENSLLLLGYGFQTLDDLSLGGNGPCKTAIAPLLIVRDWSGHRERTALFASQSHWNVAVVSRGWERCEQRGLPIADELLEDGFLDLEPLNDSLEVVPRFSLGCDGLFKRRLTLWS